MAGLKPLLWAPVTDEELAPWNRTMQGKPLQYRNTFAGIYRDADRRDAALMLWLTVRCDHERHLREEFGSAGLPGPAAVVLEHAPHLWRASPFNITCCA